MAARLVSACQGMEEKLADGSCGPGGSLAGVLVRPFAHRRADGAWVAS
jgi:hypothetical protein